MIRTTLTNDSAFMILGFRPKSTPQVITRNRAGLTASLLNDGTGGALFWVRLTRVGNTVTAFSSLEGVK